VSIANKSPELKAARGYTCPKSFVRPDGSEVLFEEDWEVRKGELWERAKGQCEWYLFGEDANLPETNEPGYFLIPRCQETSGDPCHIVPRHPRRDDRLSNLKFYCRHHHNFTEPQREKRKLHWTKQGVA
jgi:hypothetical protein